MKEINIFLSVMIIAICIVNMMFDRAVRKGKSESLEARTKREFEEDVAKIERWIDSND